VPENNYSAKVKPYDRLFLFLSRGGDSGYVFCRADNLSLIAVVNRQLVDDLAATGKKTIIVYLSTATDTPIATQIVAAAQNGDAVIISNLYEVVNGGDSGLEVAVSLNFAREVLWQTGKPIVFWGDGATMSLMANYAPDLYSQRRQATIQFTDDDVVTADAVLQTGNILTESMYLPPSNEVKEDDVNRLQQILYEAESKGAVDRRVIADVVLPLANKQAMQGNNEAVKKLLDVYQAKTEQYAEPEMLTGLGDIYRLLNEYDRAATWYRKANLLLEQQSMERSGIVIRNEQWYNNLISVADTLARNGKNLLMLGELEEAVMHIQSLMSAQKQSLLAGLWLQMGDIHYATGKLKLSKEYYIKIIDDFKEIKSNVYLQHFKSVCNSYKQLCHIFIKTGELSNAKKAADQLSEMVEGVYKYQNKTNEWYHYEFVALILHGDISTYEGKKDEAMSYYQKALSLVEILAKNSTYKHIYYRDFLLISMKMGDFLLSNKDSKLAKEHFVIALQYARMLNKISPETEEYQRDLCITLYKNSISEFDANTSAIHIAEAIQIAEKLASHNPNSEHIQTDLSGTYFEMGRIKEKLGDVGAAEKYYDDALRIVTALQAKNPDSNQIKNNRRIIQQHIDAISKKA